MGVTTAIAMRNSPMLSERKYLPEIMNSRTLFEEKRAGELIQRDEEYLKKMQELAVANLKSLGFFILYFIVILILYYNVLSRIVNHFIGYDRFAIYIVYFEALYLFNMFVYNRRIVKVQMVEVMAPQSYKITEKGILSTDKSGIYLHSRHLINAEIIDNREKKYVEIHSTTSKLPYKIRLYTTEIDRLLEVLDRVKRLESRRQQSANS